ncbi:hypothetical protein Lalb_Chr21g0315501 [Lupinus albus]|uniref:Uncharacterized protein n=1 Tax=Lupinus albus TaxID=3870 RepID=A0A6A4NGY6_LUPAL|nr:hypothetical protein Lalb_Chr21g0315501 [Lupinus albus]
MKSALKVAIALGFLMNTKGLVELIVLNIGKDRKVLIEIFLLSVFTYEFNAVHVPINITDYVIFYMYILLF